MGARNRRPKMRALPDQSSSRTREMANMQPAANVLTGRKALVVGVANEHSIAYGCAKAFRDLGADLAITYVNEKTRSYVEPLARELNASVLMPLDVTDDAQVDVVFERVRTEWGSARHFRVLSWVGAQAPERFASRVLCERFSGSDECLVPFAHSSGAAGGAPISFPGGLWHIATGGLFCAGIPD